MDYYPNNCYNDRHGNWKNVFISRRNLFCSLCFCFDKNCGKCAFLTKSLQDWPIHYFFFLGAKTRNAKSVELYKKIHADFRRLRLSDGRNRKLRNYESRSEKLQTFSPRKRIRYIKIKALCKKSKQSKQISLRHRLLKVL